MQQGRSIIENEGGIEIDEFKLKYRTERSGPDVLVIGTSPDMPIASSCCNMRGSVTRHV